ncbi:MAG: molybdopterin converting factor small subunit [Flavobacterium sp.]|jgi:molybdopterin converting factor small subunit
MATVFFSGELQKLTGEDQVIVSASNYRDLIEELALKYPTLEKKMLMEMAIAIDGLILVDPFFELIENESEIHFLHFVTGG